MLKISTISYLVVLTLLNLCLGWEPDFILRISEATVRSNCQPRDNSLVINGEYATCDHNDSELCKHTKRRSTNKHADVAEKQRVIPGSSRIHLLDSE